MEETDNKDKNTIFMLNKALTYLTEEELLEYHEWLKGLGIKKEE